MFIAMSRGLVGCLRYMGGLVRERDNHIIQSWKRCIRGEFIIERHLKKGSVFISTDDESVYMVNGIIDSWEEMLHGSSVPIIIKL